MKVSVALATFNGEKYILKQLQSIINQTRIPDEIIISDDGSNDNTLSIVNEFVREYNFVSWQILENTSEHGVVNNFKNAFSHATGDLILLCDQDDIWVKNRVQIIEKIFDTNREILCLNTSFTFIDGDDNEIFVKPCKNKSNNNLIKANIPLNDIQKIPLALVLTKNISPGMTMAVRQELLNIYLKYSHFIMIHDWELNCFAAFYNGLYFYNQSLVYYRIHDKQTVSISNLKKKSICKKIYGKITEIRKELIRYNYVIDSLLKLPSNITAKTFLQQMQRFNEYREKVVYECNIRAWFKEIYLFIKLRHTNCYLDGRYVILDFLSLFIDSNT